MMRCIGSILDWETMWSIIFASFSDYEEPRITQEQGDDTF